MSVVEFFSDVCPMSADPEIIVRPPARSSHFELLLTTAEFDWSHFVKVTGRLSWPPGMIRPENQPSLTN